MMPLVPFVKFAFGLIALHVVSSMNTGRRESSVLSKLRPSLTPWIGIFGSVLHRNVPITPIIYLPNGVVGEISGQVLLVTSPVISSTLSFEH